MPHHIFWRVYFHWYVPWRWRSRHRLVQFLLENSEILKNVYIGIFGFVSLERINRNQDDLKWAIFSFRQRKVSADCAEEIKPPQVGNCEKALSATPLECGQPLVCHMPGINKPTWRVGAKAQPGGSRFLINRPGKWSSYSMFKGCEEGRDSHPEFPQAWGPFFLPFSLNKIASVSEGRFRAPL